jgi:hypothetical protein
MIISYTQSTTRSCRLPMLSLITLDPRLLAFVTEFLHVAKRGRLKPGFSRAALPSRSMYFLLPMIHAWQAPRNHQ